MASWVWILIVITIAAVAAIAALTARQRRTAVLRRRFGPEYDRAVQAREDRRAAEADLRARERQRAQFEIVPLPESARLEFLDEWRDVQELFVDEPAQAVEAADALVTRVMAARGYPMSNFEGQADLLSVDYPDVVDNYRAAHEVREMSATQQASTEDLREALLRYRSLFDQLLTAENAASPRDEAAAAPAAEPGGEDQAMTGVDSERR
jgi:hypothetical protein